MNILELVKSLSEKEFRELEDAIKLINEERKGLRLTIKDFVAIHRSDISTRLRHALERAIYLNYDYMDELNREIVFNLYFAGQKTVIELECLMREFNINTEYYMSKKPRKRY